MSFGNVKGITVEINGDSSKLQAELKKITSQYAGLDRTMSALKKSMKMDNGVLNDYRSLGTYQDLLGKKIEQTSRYLQTNQKALSNFDVTVKEWEKDLNKASASVTAYSNSLTKERSNYDALIQKQQEVSASLEKLEEDYRNGTVTDKQYASEKKKLRQALADVNVELQKSKSAILNAQAGLEASEESVKELTYNLEHQDEALLKLNADVERYKNELYKLKYEMISTQPNIVAFTQKFTLLGNGLINAGKALTTFGNALKPLSTATGVLLAGSAYEAIQFEDAWAGVIKTVEGTPQQLEKVNDGLKELATTTASSYQEIASFAEVAGQMGVATDEIVGFTKVITELRDTTNLDGEEGAKALAQFANIMVDKGERTTEYYERLGSVIVDLGNNFATTEQDITLMAQRMAVAGNQAGMNSQEVLALSTALSSMGIRAQEGGSSMSKMMQRITLGVETGGEDLYEYAHIAGMTADEFAKAWRDDAGEAFIRFVYGIANGTDEAKSSLQILDELGITSEIKLTKTMGSLANSTDLYRDAMDRASKAYEENTALAIEADKRYSTLKSKLSQTWENIKQLGDEIGQNLTPYIQGLLDHVNNLVNYFKNLDDAQKKNITRMLAMTTTLAPLFLGLGKVTTGVGKLLVGVGMAPQKLIDTIVQLNSFRNATELYDSEKFRKELARALELLEKDTEAKVADTVATEAQGDVAVATANKEDVLTKSTVLNTVATKANALTLKYLGLSLKGVLGGLAVVAVATIALVTAFKKMNKAYYDNLKATDEYYKKSQEVIDQYDDYKRSVEERTQSARKTIEEYQEESKATEKLSKNIGELIEKEKLNSYQKEELANYVQELNTVYPELNLSVDESTGKLMDENGVIIDNVKSLQEYIDKMDEASRKRAIASSSQSYIEALIEEKKEYARIKSSMDDMNEEMNTLYKTAKNNGWTNADIAKLKAYQKQLVELKKDFTETGSQIQETKQELIELNNFSETNSYSKIGKGLKLEFEDAYKEAKEAGYYIPTNLAEGIKENTDIKDVTKWLSLQSAYDTMIDEATFNGQIIPEELAKNIIYKSSSVEEASEKISNLMAWEDLVDSAGLTGMKIPKALTESIAKGDVDIAKAYQHINDLADFQDAVKKAKIAGKDIPKGMYAEILNGNLTVKEAMEKLGVATDISDTTSKNGANAGKSFADGLNTGLSNTDSTVSRYMNKIKTNTSVNMYNEGLQTGNTWINGFANALNSGSSVIANKIKEIKAKGNPLSLGTILGFTNGYNDYLDGMQMASLSYSPNSVGATTDIITSAINTSSMRSASSDYGNVNKNTMNRLNSFIDSLENANLQIVLQPQTMNGEVVADAVIEEISIRELLGNIGKGNN